jgi:hypothetical protein
MLTHISSRAGGCGAGWPAAQSLESSTINRITVQPFPLVDNHLREEFKTILVQRQESYDTPAVEQEARKALGGVAIDCRDAMNEIMTAWR